MNLRTFPNPKATKTISAPEMSFAAIFNKKEDCKTVSYGNRDREYQPQRFCVKPHYPSSQPQNNGVYNHIDKYQNINIDSQAPHPNIFYHGSVEKRVGICNRY